MTTEQVGLVYGVEFGQDCIRDNVYGDILIPRKFLPIIDSYEFQRLRNIKQLATAQYAFPGANHTRFAHSIGTFHVMQRIVAHFDRYFHALGQPLIPEREKELILAASLLHDLGHTPFSHALEDTLQNAQKIPHEKWTVDIIQHEGTSLYKALKELFGENGPQEVASLINLQHDDNAMTPFFSASEIKLKNIFHSLISSQLDADRLDYIRRDSIAVGVSYGMIDLDRIIGGFRIGILDSGKAVVCVAEEHLPDVEGYLYARYQMYRNVYLNPFKMFTEELLRKIVRNVYALYDRDCLKTSDLPLGFKPALQKSPMDMEDFLLLDDSVIMGAVKGWAKLRDGRAWLLKKLCQCMVQRNGYERYLFADTSPETLSLFKKDLIGLLKTYIPEKVFKQKDAETWIQDFPFVVLRTASPQLYKNERENIYVLENSGRIVDIFDCSNLVRAFSGKGDLISAIYLNEEILRLYLEKETFFRGLTKEERDNLSKEVRKLFESRAARNSIEIEKKYYFPQEGRSLDWERVQMQLYSALSEMGYSVHPSNGETSKFELPEPVTQTDYYFDTSEKSLHLARCSLRVRIKGDKAELTCKRPVSGSKSCGEHGQMERYEYAHILKDVNLSRIPDIFLQEEGAAFVEKYLQGMVSCDELKTTITIINNRTRYIVEKKSDSQQIKEQYELAFDDVIFENKVTCRSYSEKQIELELKSDPSTRLNMQALTNHLERDFAYWNMTVMTESKYERAKKFTE